MTDGLPGPVIAVVGPTGVGKSALAEEIAVRLGGAVVSADSMQVYRGMDIGTAKVPLGRRRVEYRCVDLVDPGTPYSAALYQSDARHAIEDLLARGVPPVVAGGTGLYVRAALDEMSFPSGHASDGARERVEALASALGAEGLHRRLAELDPEAAALIHPNNTRRVARALEMLEGGVSYAAQASGFGERRAAYRTAYIGLTMDRATLYAAIDARVERMLDEGLFDEVSRLLEAGYRDALTASQAIGYKEMVPVIEGDTERESAVAAVKQATRRYAKRQLTWFRADPRVAWVDVTGLSLPRAADAATALIQSGSRT